jgi:hypothetical protein
MTLGIGSVPSKHLGLGVEGQWPVAEIERNSASRSTDGRKLAEWLSLLRSADSNSERTQLPPRSIWLTGSGSRFGCLRNGRCATIPQSCWSCFPRISNRATVRTISASPDGCYTAIQTLQCPAPSACLALADVRNFSITPVLLTNRPSTST